MTRQEALDAGYTVYCVQCQSVAKAVPVREVEMGHGDMAGRDTTCPVCLDCDLWRNLVDDSAAR